jgi:general secretion pathway protein C
MTRIYYIIFNLIALAGIIYFGVDTFYRIAVERLNWNDTQGIAMQNVAHRERQDEARLSDYNVIDDRNISSKIKRLDSKGYSAEVEELEPTSLRVRLLGTVAGDRANAVAVIEDTSKRTQEIYRVGDSVQEAVVKSILRGKVVLAVGNRDEILVMEEPASGDSDDRQESVTERSQGVERMERTITLRHANIDESLEDINDLLSQASIRAHYTDNQSDGLAITGIKAGSIFRRMGLRNGDIIRGVSDNEIKSPEDVIVLYNDLKSETDVSLQITRRGREMSLNYSFRD